MATSSAAYDLQKRQYKFWVRLIPDICAHDDNGDFFPLDEDPDRYDEVKKEIFTLVSLSSSWKEQKEEFVKIVVNYDIGHEKTVYYCIYDKKDKFPAH